MKLKMISQTKFDFHFATAVQMKKFIGIKSNRKCLLNISLKEKEKLHYYREKRKKSFDHSACAQEESHNVFSSSLPVQNKTLNLAMCVIFWYVRIESVQKRFRCQQSKRYRQSDISM